MNTYVEEPPRATLPNPVKPLGGCIVRTAGVYDVPARPIEGAPPGLAFAWRDAVSVPAVPAGGVNPTVIWHDEPAVSCLPVHPSLTMPKSPLGLSEPRPSPMVPEVTPPVLVIV